MQKLITVILAGVFFMSCNNKGRTKYFEVSGVIANSNAKYIYLEKVPANNGVTSVEDSAKLDAGGKFTLTAKPSEAAVFNLRLDQNMYPVASVINDTDKVNLTIQLNKENQQFADKYEVKGSPASQEMKDFMYSFGNSLQSIYGFSKQAESLQKEGAADSVLFPIMTKSREVAENIKQLTLTSIEKASNPALAIFELGYYQGTANGSGFGLEPFSNEKLNELVASTAKKFPKHDGIATIKNTLDEQARKAAEASWIGKEAPDFEMPDVNGTPVKLSSFRGKYVLVDFWASWCGPCRAENPNVVRAFDRFKNKNFTILGVSLDRPGQKDNWLKAIKDDKLNWPQISDLQYWQSAVVPLYRFEGIPFNILLDPQGKVIAEGLRGEQLFTKLEETLGR